MPASQSLVDTSTAEARKLLSRVENPGKQLAIAGDPFRGHHVKENISMISKCANPNCSRPLVRLIGGRFFGFPTSKKRVEHFWLCRPCSANYTLKHHKGKVELVVREKKTA